MGLGNHKWHRVKPNHGSEGPENVVCVYSPLVAEGGMDADGFPIGNYTFQSGFAIGIRRKSGKWYGESSLSFTNTDVFWAWLQQWTRKKSPVWVYSHGWSDQSQLLRLWHEIDAGRIKLSIPPEERKDNGLAESKENKGWAGLCCIENKPFIVYAVGKTGTYKFCDMLNYIDISVDELLETESTYTTGTQAGTAENVECSSYAMSVATALKRLIIGLMTLWKNGNMGTWQPTAGRLSMSNYRHKHIDTRLVCHRPYVPKVETENKQRMLEYLKDKVEWKAKLLERDCYIGGEIRHWYKGSVNEEVFQIDVTSHYAAGMRDCALPYLLVDYREGKNCEEVAEKYGWENCCADVVIETFEDNYPIRIKRSVCWPTGKFHACLCGAELASAASAGAIKSVGRISAYKCDYILRDYAGYWIHEKRRTKDCGDTIGEMLAKTMLVSLYGKFGALGNKWVVRENVFSPERWGTFVRWDQKEGGFRRFRTIGGTAQVECERGERLDSIVSIPAFLCSDRRKKIRDFRLTLPYRSVYLQQTDSLLLTGRGYDVASQSSEFNSGNAGSWRDKGRWSGLHVYSANQWEAGQKGTGGSEIECFAGIPATRRTVDYSEWRIGTKVSASQAARTGPSGIVATGIGRFTIRDMTGNMGHYSDGWSDAPVSVQHLQTIMELGNIEMEEQYCKKMQDSQLSYEQLKAELGFG